ncbi:MAG: hypothetical protein HZB16_06260 [Armatimonadetes bacterium]|nr:hypothetical protein [Armatimonadota bacterium]
MTSRTDATAPRVLAAGDSSRSASAHMGYVVAVEQWSASVWSTPQLGLGLLVTGLALVTATLLANRRWRIPLAVVTVATLAVAGIALQRVSVYGSLFGRP